MADHLATFYRRVEEDFAFLSATYQCHLSQKDVDRRGTIQANDIRDTYVTVVYLGSAVEVDVQWDVASSHIRVWLIELLEPYVRPTKWYAWGNSTATAMARAVNVVTLAEMAGAADDPDLMLEQVSTSHARRREGMLAESRKSDRRFALLQSSFDGVLARLAHATERYASGILRGDHTMFSEGVAFTTQKARKSGMWEVQIESSRSDPTE
jgi:hypothetical protein